MTAILRVLLPIGAGLLVLAGSASLLCPGGSCPVPQFDATGLAQARDWSSPTLDGFAQAVTWLGSLYVLVPLVMLAAWRDSRHLGWASASFAPAALALASTVAYLAKLLVLRPRPDLYPALQAMPLDSSFPSAHAMQATAAVLGLMLCPGRQPDQRLWAAGVLLVIAVGMSRVHLQVHFPSDVLAGILAAALLVLGLRGMPPWRGATS